MDNLFDDITADIFANHEDNMENAFVFAANDDTETTPVDYQQQNQVDEDYETYGYDLSNATTSDNEGDFGNPFEDIPDNNSDQNSNGLEDHATAAGDVPFEDDTNDFGNPFADIPDNNDQDQDQTANNFGNNAYGNANATQPLVAPVIMAPVIMAPPVTIPVMTAPPAIPLPASVPVVMPNGSVIDQYQLLKGPTGTYTAPDPIRFGNIDPTVLEHLALAIQGNGIEDQNTRDPAMHPNYRNHFPVGEVRRLGNNVVLWKILKWFVRPHTVLPAGDPGIEDNTRDWLKDRNGTIAHPEDARRHRCVAAPRPGAGLIRLLESFLDGATKIMVDNHIRTKTASDALAQQRFRGVQPALNNTQGVRTRNAGRKAAKVAANQPLRRAATPCPVNMVQPQPAAAAAQPATVVQPQSAAAVMHPSNATTAVQPAINNGWTWSEYTFGDIRFKTARDLVDHMARGDQDPEWFDEWYGGLSGYEAAEFDLALDFISSLGF